MIEHRFPSFSSVDFATRPPPHSVLVVVGSAEDLSCNIAAFLLYDGPSCSPWGAVSVRGPPHILKLIEAFGVPSRPSTVFGFGKFEHSKWYLRKFGETRTEWYVFPFGKPQPTDPTRSVVSSKTSWSKIRKNTGITGRWHENRHTFITDLAESGEAGDETIRDIAGHVSKQMLKHFAYQHGGEAPRRRCSRCQACEGGNRAKSS